MAAIGVLALQGGYAAHIRALRDIGEQAVEVRTASQLEPLSGLVLPGGESSTMLHLIQRFGLWEPLNEFYASSRPILATCAGLILSAREVQAPGQRSFGWIDVRVSRNAWGRQVHSFEAVADSGLMPLVFIRAPRILDAGPHVEVLATYHGEPILVRQGNLTGATFHPELTDDRRIHALFSKRCQASLPSEAWAEQTGIIRA